MTHAHDAAAKLLAGMQSDLEQRESGEMIDFRSKYEGAIQSIGPIPLFTELFRSVEGSTLSAYLRALTFLWKDMPFSTWREILYRISDSPQAVYQFVWFTSPFLRLDVLSMIRTDPNVDEAARDFIDRQFPSGAPAPAGDIEKDILVTRGVDPAAMWRQLAAEGAPMKIDPSDLK